MKDMCERLAKALTWQTTEEREQLVRAARKRDSTRASEYATRRRKVDEDFRIRIYLRAYLNYAVKSKRKRRNLELESLVGCTRDELRAHLESLWEPGMDWTNRTRNGWHIDHIRECHTFDLTKRRQVRECFHWTNLQPLWAYENMAKKGPKRIATKRALEGNV